MVRSISVLIRTWRMRRSFSWVFQHRLVRRRAVSQYRSTMSEPQQEPDKNSERSSERESPRPRSTAEWTTLVGSLVVVALLIGAALYEHFGREELPGTWISIEIATEDAVQRDDVFYIPFTAINRGSKPAEDTTIMFEIKDGEETV